MVNYYSSDGSLIVENQTRMENNGYPLDLAVSPDGAVIAVSYLIVDSEKSPVIWSSIILARQARDR